MSVLFVASLFFYYVQGENIIPLESIKRHDLTACVSDIVKKHYIKEITYIDINSDEDILQSIKDHITISTVSRNLQIKMLMHTKNYLIHAGSVSDFIRNFKCLTSEPFWEPTAKFLIIFNEMENIRSIFDELLRLHVLNALIVDTADDNHLYTYNPFENYGCGRHYERIISYGKCLQPTAENLFPEKLVTGLRNCTFTVEAVHWPPYAINPRIYALMGVEQFILKTLAGVEQFKLNYTYSDNAESFATVDVNMTATGPLKSLQDNTAHITIGGMVLNRNRAAAFDIICSHIPFVEEIVILVKKAGIIYNWKYILVEFSPVVWVMVILSFAAYALFVVMFLGVKDKSLLVMKMFGALLLHGIKVGSHHPAKKCLLMCWVWFAFLVSSHYLCNLTSLTTNPLKSFQISTLEDLVTYNMKACVCPIMLTEPEVNKNNPQHDNITEGCDNLYQSIKTVSNRDDAYAVALSEIYKFYKHEFCDESSCKIFQFPRPVRKVLYAMYLYKGFPGLNRLNQLVVRISESGLITKALDIIYIASDLRNRVFRREFQYLVLIPWHALVYGWIVSIIIFVLELTMGQKRSE